MKGVKTPIAAEPGFDTLHDAYKLLVDALELYRKEHKTDPARVVLCKTSRHNAGEHSAIRGRSKE